VEYNAIDHKTLEYIIIFHGRFEYIHPFQDGNGLVGRLILFKGCLKHNIVPFIVSEDPMFCFCGLSEWNNERGYLLDTCLTAQCRFKKYPDHFRIGYERNKNNI